MLTQIIREKRLQKVYTSEKREVFLLGKSHFANITKIYRKTYPSIFPQEDANNDNIMVKVFPTANECQYNSITQLSVITGRVVSFDTITSFEVMAFRARRFITFSSSSLR